VRPFSGLGGKWRVSTEGGTSPHWSATTHERLLLNLSGKVMLCAVHRRRGVIPPTSRRFNFFDELRRIAPAKREKAKEEARAFLPAAAFEIMSTGSVN
jgi:hypothetical protein